MFDPSARSYKTHLYFPSSIEGHHDSGVCSPPLWRTSPPTSPHRRPNNYRSLSPTSKAQAIARGQRELMEMVSKMPESSYELSLKDLVEVNANEENERKVFDEVPQRTKRPSGVVKKMKSDKWKETNRNGGINHSGLFLKMVFPVNLSSKKKTQKKKKNEKDGSVTSKSSQVSPRPSISEGPIKTDDNDWWTKEFSGSGGSESGISSNNSGSTKSSGSSSSNSSSGNRGRSSVRDGSSGCLSLLWNLHLRE